MAKKARPPALPDGIDDSLVAPRRGVARHASVLSAIVLGTVVALGLSGRAGGKIVAPGAETPEVALRVEMPDVVRNGEMLEARVHVRAKRTIGKLVIGIESALLRELTVNTMVPAAGEESHVQGAFRFAFGKLEAGEEFVYKIDGQVNPTLFGSNRGRISVLDGKAPLAAVEASLRVLP